MIELQYDVNTAGTRVSFVIKDGELTMEIPDHLKEACKLGKSVDGVCTLPQNDKTLEMVMLWAQYARQGISK